MALTSSALLLTLCLQQSAPLPEAPREVDTYAAFVGQHLLTVSSDRPLTLRQGGREVTLSDVEFTSLFQLVPEAQEVARRAQDAHAAALAPTVLSWAMWAGSGAIDVILLTGLSTLWLPLLATALVLMAGAVVLFFLKPDHNVPDDVLRAVNVHNQGLISRRPAPSGQEVR